jgi:hypothetical protein
MPDPRTKTVVLESLVRKLAIHMKSVSVLQLDGLSGSMDLDAVEAVGESKLLLP